LLEGKPAVFISCSEKYRESIGHAFRELLESIGIHGIILSEAPRLGRTWTPEEKLGAYLRQADAMLVLPTPDDQMSGSVWHSRQNLYDELGRARTLGRLKHRICVNKSHEVSLPSNLDPAYEPLDLDDIQPAQRAFLRQLRAWGYTFEEPTLEPGRGRATPRVEVPSAGLLEGLDYVEREPIAIRVRGLLSGTPKSEQSEIVRSIQRFMTQGSDLEQGTAASMIETVIEIDPGLVSTQLIDDMSRNDNFTVRTSASVSLFLLATIVPGLVPIDIVSRLARPSTEDWYVFTPALNCLKELALHRPEAIEALAVLARSTHRDDREYSVVAFRDIASIRPEVVPRQVIVGLLSDDDESVRRLARELADRLPADEVRFPHQHFGAF